MSENLCPTAYLVLQDNGFVTPAKTIQEAIDFSHPKQSIEIYQRVGSVGKYFQYLCTVTRKEVRKNGLS